MIHNLWRPSKATLTPWPLLLDYISQLNTYSLWMRAWWWSVQIIVHNLWTLRGPYVMDGFGLLVNSYQRTKLVGQIDVVRLYRPSLLLMKVWLNYLCFRNQNSKIAAFIFSVFESAPIVWQHPFCRNRFITSISISPFILFGVFNQLRAHLGCGTYFCLKPSSTNLKFIDDQ